MALPESTGDGDVADQPEACVRLTTLPTPSASSQNDVVGHEMALRALVSPLRS